MTKKEAFEFLDRLAAGIAVMFGENCETIVHEIHDGQIKNVSIYNGHVSGRSSGSSYGILHHSLVDTKDIRISDSRDYLNQLVIIKGNRQIKSSTFLLRGEDYTYALGINYDITLMSRMEKLLAGLTSTEGDLYEALGGTTAPGDSQLDTLYGNALAKFSISVSSFKKEDRLALVSRLLETGFFNIQKSVPYLSEKLQVSKYTIYKYINQLNENQTL